MKKKKFLGFIIVVITFALLVNVIHGFIIKEVSSNGLLLENMSSIVQSDKKVVMAAISQNGMALQYASEELRADREIVMVAVAENGSALQYASEELRADREIVMIAVSENGFALKYTTEDLQADKEIVISAVSARCYGYDEYKLFYDNRTKEFVYVPLFVCDSLYKRYSIIELRTPISNDSFEVTISEVVDNYENYNYGNYEIVMVENDYQPIVRVESCSALQYVNKELREDRDIVLAAVSRQGYALAYAGSELKKDKQIVMRAVAQNSCALRYASVELKNDRDVINNVSPDGEYYYYYMTDSFYDDVYCEREHDYYVGMRKIAA